jgi:hypothetical protein
MPYAKHTGLESAVRNKFCWNDFVAREELIRYDVEDKAL